MTERHPPSPEFIYFDLGNVLLFFDHHRACRQLAALTGVEAQQIWDLLFGSGRELEFERGQLSGREVYEEFARATAARLDYEAFATAFSDIFEVNVPVKALLGQLAFCNYPLGILSNTNELHWQLLTDGRYSLIPAAFEQLVLSHEVGSIKPEPEIFEAAIQKAGVPPERIFFMDDMPQHVAGARALGIDAVRYTDPATLVADLRGRGVEFNF